MRNRPVARRAIVRGDRSHGQARRTGAIVACPRAKQALQLTHRCIVLKRGRVVNGADSQTQLQDMPLLDNWVAVRLQ